MTEAPTQSLGLSDIPGFQEALAKAQHAQVSLRESAMLNLSHDILGFTIRTMTVADYVILLKMGSPFLYRTEPDMTQLALFLWLLSPQFKKWEKRKSSIIEAMSAYLHGRKVRRAFGKYIPETSEKAVAACFEYIDKMFFDAPPGMVKGQDSGLSYLTGWFDALQSEYGMRTDEVWNMGLPELFQRLAAIRMRRSPQVPVFSKGTDKLKFYILTGIRSNQFTIEDLERGRVHFPNVN